MATAEELYLTDIKHKRDLVRTSTGTLETESGFDNFTNAIFRRVMTSPGSLSHRPNYGVGLKDYMNSLNTLDQRRSLARRMDDQLSQDPRVEEVLGVEIRSEDNDPERVNIIVRVKPIGYKETQIEITTFGGEIVDGSAAQVVR